MVVLRSATAGHVVVVRTGGEIVKPNALGIRTPRPLRIGRGGATKIAAQMSDDNRHQWKTAQK